MLTRISPAFAVANWVTTHSALFSDQMPIRSPALQPQRQQPGGERLRPLDKFAITPAYPLAAHDERGRVGDAGGGAVEVLPDRLAQQRHGDCAVDVADGHGRSSRL